MLKGKLHTDFRSISRVTPANEKRKKKRGFDEHESGVAGCLGGCFRWRMKEKAAAKFYI